MLAKYFQIFVHDFLSFLNLCLLPTAVLKIQFVSSLLRFLPGFPGAIIFNHFSFKSSGCLHIAKNMLILEYSFKFYIVPRITSVSLTSFFFSCEGVL